MTITPEEEIVIGAVQADPMRHAHTVFDLIHTHEGAGTRGIDPLIVERHRSSMIEAVLEVAENILAAEVKIPLPAKVVGTRTMFARGRVQNAISQFLYHTHMAMIEAGLSSDAQRVPLAPSRAMFAAALADEVLAKIRSRSPEAVNDLEQRAVAA